MESARAAERCDIAFTSRAASFTYVAPLLLLSLHLSSLEHAAHDS